MSHKTFVLDTNVLLHDPESILKFPKSKIILPITVIEELDTMKRLPNELGKNSRAIFRLLVDLSLKKKGDFHQGIELENEAVISIHLNDSLLPGHLPLAKSDNRIIACAYHLKSEGQKVVFVSKDFAARIKAEALGIEAEDYENLKFAYTVLYKGIEHIETEKINIDTFFKDGSLKLENLVSKPNEYYVLTSPEHSSAVAKFDKKDGKLKPLLKVPNIWGIHPKNVEQKCAVDLLLRDDIKLVTMIGTAGTGKTLLALACGLRKVFDEGVYTKILISRPVVPLGRDIGYLPGTKEEKLFHWMQPIYDNLEFLCSSSGNESSETLQWVLDSKKIELEAVTYIRGRSLPKMYIIVDEAQNLTPHEVKTIISRAGEETKVILTGDPTQIDNPYLDKDSNGLTYVVGKFADEPIYGQIFLTKTERSELAAKAAEIL
ncbi:PhoH family protein [Criblamydia sequanensis]|uniref:PhoH family protein n=1 Tax=Candidatus Criblamydia sequanensis CRIB-18 TaxID=1437425 RepID=A0A090D1U7_9BACT|nr:PhoH family protein [Criblamydia sequanensis]CDR34100.1 PhoH family protein [Criblamydia sequanensis CRIB-18]